MRLTLAALALLLLQGCASVIQKSASSQIMPATKVVSIVWHKGKLPDIQAASFQIKGVPSFNVYGFFHVEDGVCHVYVEDTPQALETLGHEVKHCFDGYWHYGNGKQKEWAFTGVSK